jgi:hypothetical protein
VNPKEDLLNVRLQCIGKCGCSILFDKSSQEIMNNINCSIESFNYFFLEVGLKQD